MAKIRRKMIKIKFLTKNSAILASNRSGMFNVLMANWSNNENNYPLFHQLKIKEQKRKQGKNGRKNERFY